MEGHSLKAKGDTTNEGAASPAIHMLASFPMGDHDLKSSKTNQVTKAFLFLELSCSTRYPASASSLLCTEYGGDRIK